MVLTQYKFSNTQHNNTGISHYAGAGVFPYAGIGRIAVSSPAVLC